MNWLHDIKIQSKVFDLIVVCAFIAVFEICLIPFVYSYLKEDIQIRIDLSRDEIKGAICDSIAETKIDAEWQSIRDYLINTKMLTSEQCFKMAGIIQSGCKRVRMSPSTFLALMMVESEMDRKCVFRGAKGICQVMDVTQLEAIGVTPNYRWDDPIKNTSVCLRYFEYIRAQTRFVDETDELMLCRGYNVGPFSDKLKGDAANKYARKIAYYKDVSK